MNSCPKKELKNLIKNATKSQLNSDVAIKKTLNELKQLCKNPIDYQNAEEAVLLFIYEQTDTNDNKITLDMLIEHISRIIDG